jgi:hypothetical protein
LRKSLNILTVYSIKCSVESSPYASGIGLDSTDAKWEKIPYIPQDVHDLMEESYRKSRGLLTGVSKCLDGLLFRKRTMHGEEKGKIKGLAMWYA